MLSDWKQQFLNWIQKIYLLENMIFLEMFGLCYQKIFDKLKKYLLNVSIILLDTFDSSELNKSKLFIRKYEKILTIYFSTLRY